MNELDKAREIEQVQKPKAAMDIGQSIDTTDSDWEDGKVQVMREILEDKYHACPPFAEALQSSGSKNCS